MRTSRAHVQMFMINCEFASSLGWSRWINTPTSYVIFVLSSHMTHTSTQILVDKTSLSRIGASSAIGVFGIFAITTYSHDAPRPAAVRAKNSRSVMYCAMGSVGWASCLCPHACVARILAKSSPHVQPLWPLVLCYLFYIPILLIPSPVLGAIHQSPAIGCRAFARLSLLWCTL